MLKHGHIKPSVLPINMPFQPAHSGTYDEITQFTATEDTAHPFLFNTGILKSSMTCPCSSAMDLKSCASSKSADLFTWRCPSCRKYKNILSDSVLSGSNLSFRHFLQLIFFFSEHAVSN